MKNPNIKKSTLTKTDKVLIPIILIIFFLVGSYVLAVVLEAIELITK